MYEYSDYLLIPQTSLDWFFFLFYWLVGLFLIICSTKAEKQY